VVPRYIVDSIKNLDNIIEELEIEGVNVKRVREGILESSHGEELLRHILELTKIKGIKTLDELNLALASVVYEKKELTGYVIDLLHKLGIEIGSETKKIMRAYNLREERVNRLQTLLEMNMDRVGSWIEDTTRRYDIECVVGADFNGNVKAEIYLASVEDVMQIGEEMMYNPMVDVYAHVDNTNGVIHMCTPIEGDPGTVLLWEIYLQETV